MGGGVKGGGVEGGWVEGWRGEGVDGWMGGGVKGGWVDGWKRLRLETGVLRRLGLRVLIWDRTPVSRVLHPTHKIGSPGRVGGECKEF